MLHTAGNIPRYFLPAGLALFIAQLGIFIFASEPFYIGLWPLAEPVIIAVYALSSLGALWLAVGLQRGWLQMYYRPHPLWWVFFGWIGWQLCALPFAASFWRSWFGYAAHGQGTAWYISVWLSALLAIALWEKPSLRRWMLVAAGALLIVQSALFLAPANSEYASLRPVKFGAYLAFSATWWWIAALLSDPSKAPQRFLPYSAVVLFALYVCDSKTAILLITPALFLTYLGIEFKNSALFRVRNWQRQCGIAAIMLTAIGWVAVSLLPNAFPNHRDSLAIRASMNEIGIRALQDEPARLIAGHGWGDFINDNYKYALTDGSYLYKDGEYAPYAPLYESPAFHSHNQPLETLLAIGLPGLLLFLALPALLLWYIPAAHFWLAAPMLGAVTVMGCLWFYIPHHLAYIALGIAAMYTYCIPPRHTARRINLAAAILLLLASASLAWSARTQYREAVYGQTLQQAVFNEDYGTFSAAWISRGLQWGGDRFDWIVRTSITADLFTDALTSANNAGWIDRLIYAAHEESMRPHASAANILSELELYNRLHPLLQDYAYAAQKTAIENNWLNAILRAAAAAPERDDMATEYLLWLEATTPSAARIEPLRQILQIAPSHRGAKYVLGQALLNISPDSPEGKTLQFEAISRGIADIMPLVKNNQYLD